MKFGQLLDFRLSIFVDFLVFFGGPIGAAGRQLGSTSSTDLSAEGKVYSYRATMKTMFDALGCDHAPFFPADEPFDDLFIA